MGRRKKPDEMKAKSKSFSLSKKHEFMFGVIKQIIGKRDSDALQHLIEDYYIRNCKQEIINE